MQSQKEVREGARNQDLPRETAPGSVQGTVTADGSVEALVVRAMVRASTVVESPKERATRARVLRPKPRTGGTYVSPGTTVTSVVAGTVGGFTVARFVSATIQLTAVRGCPVRRTKTLLVAATPPANDKRHQGALPPWDKSKIRERLEEVR